MQYGNAQQGSNTANGGASPPTATGVYGVNPASRGPYGAPSASAAGYGGPAQNHGTALTLCLWEAFCQGPDEPWRARLPIARCVALMYCTCALTTFEPCLLWNLKQEM